MCELMSRQIVSYLLDLPEKDEEEVERAQINNFDTLWGETGENTDSEYYDVISDLIIFNEICMLKQTYTVHISRRSLETGLFSGQVSLGEAERCSADMRDRSHVSAAAAAACCYCCVRC